MVKYRFPLNLQLFPEEGAAAEAGAGAGTGVEGTSVAGEQGSQGSADQGGQAGQAGQTATGTTATQSGVDDAGAAGQSKEFATALKAREEQLRLQLDKEYQEKFGPVQQHSQYLQKMARLEGFGDDVAGYLKAIDDFEQKQTIANEAKRHGMSEEQYKQWLQPVNDQLRTTQTELQTLKHQELVRQVQSQIDTLKAAHPDFEKYQDKVFELAANNGYPLEVAYKIATYDDRINSVKVETEQETLRKLNENASTSSGSLSQGGNENSSSYAKMTPEQRRAFAEKVKRGEATELP